MLELILNKYLWLASATGLGLLAVFSQSVRLHRSGVPAKTRAATGFNLFLGTWIAVLGIGHLVAVTTGGLLGTLSPHIEMEFVIPFGLALTLPGGLLLASNPGVLAGQPSCCKTALATNAFLVLVLLWSAPPVAAFPALGFWLIWRTREDWGGQLGERTLQDIRSTLSGAVATAFRRQEKRPGTD